MSRVLLTWEMGRNLGHLTRLLPIAVRLKSRGHTVMACVRDMTSAAMVLRPDGIPFIQSPGHTSSLSTRQQAMNYADLLLAQGWHDRNELWGILHGWLNVFKLYQPQAAVIDYSPGANLAAKILRIPRILIGTGFELPPLTSPLHTFPDMPSMVPEKAHQSEQHLLDNINAVLDSLHIAHLTRLSELIEGDARVLLTLPEQDHYGARDEGHYVGPIADLNFGTQVPWPGNSARRVFAYLRPEMTEFATILKGLAAMEASIICHAPRITPDMAKLIDAQNITLASLPVPLAKIFEEADVCVSYAPAATVTSALLKGIPQLLAPFHIEGYLTAGRLEQLGAGLVLRGSQTPGTIKSMLNRLLVDPQFKMHAVQFSQRYQHINQQSAIDAVVQHVEQSMRHRVAMNVT